MLYHGVLVIKSKLCVKSISCLLIPLLASADGEKTMIILSSAGLFNHKGVEFMINGGVLKDHDS